MRALAILAAVAAAGCVTGGGGRSPGTVFVVPIDDSPVLGAADAWVTVVEFTDLQCPYCRSAQGTLAGLRERYGADLRVVLKHDPIPSHPDAHPAALAAECAGAQGQFWPYADLLFERQSEVGDDAYRAWAREVPGLDAARFEACLSRAEPAPRIARDQALAARLGLTALPTFFVNGRRLVGTWGLSALIDEELARAKASAIPALEYYPRVVERAQGR
jgi:protein-disulfide isomerase